MPKLEGTKYLCLISLLVDNKTAIRTFGQLVDGGRQRGMSLAKWHVIRRHDSPAKRSNTRCHRHEIKLVPRVVNSRSLALCAVRYPKLFNDSVIVAPECDKLFCILRVLLECL